MTTRCTHGTLSSTLPCAVQLACHLAWQPLHMAGAAVYSAASARIMYLLSALYASATLLYCTIKVYPTHGRLVNTVRIGAYYTRKLCEGVSHHATLHAMLVVLHTVLNGRLHGRFETSTSLLRARCERSEHLSGKEIQCTSKSVRCCGSLARRRVGNAFRRSARGCCRKIRPHRTPDYTRVLCRVTRYSGKEQLNGWPRLTRTSTVEDRDCGPLGKVSLN